METNNLIFILILLLSFGFFGFSVRRLIAMLNIGKPEDRLDKLGARFKKMFVVALGQTKILREPLAGILHALIFWGFVVLLSAVIEAMGEGIISGFSLRFLGPLYEPLIFLQDLFAGFVLLAVFGAILHRTLFKPKRLELGLHSMIDAVAILKTIFLIMVTMLGQNATRMIIEGSGGEGTRFLSAMLIPIFGGCEPDQLKMWFEIFWWTHIVLVLGFLNYLPYSKHLHVLTSLPNVFFSTQKPYGEIPPIDLEAENVETFGASDVEDLTWKQLLDGYTCTECGRCTASCPANLTGKLLSPRKIIMDTRSRLLEKARELKKKNGEAVPSEKSLLHHYITPQELFACTTCMACMQECPVNIEHVNTIVELRRNLVLMESSFPQEVQTVFRNLENNFAPWAFSSSSRADWAEGLDIKTMSTVQEVDVLFWVGCAGSFDARYQKVSVAFSNLMKKAGISFGILGTEEKCTGDSARRIGNEYLAQILMKDNISTLNKYSFKKVVTMCPHCFNMLKNEYPQFGGNYDVVHHTDFLLDLIKQGKLKVSKEVKTKITYHDSCYLGRYNSIYDSPRETLESISGVELVEMNRNKSRGLCCGAGGGRMWMEETEGKRVNHERTEEALSLKPDVIGTACPFCMTMLTDGVKDKESAENVSVKDIAEILVEAVESEQL